MAPTTGVLRNWNASRGFGFIRPDDGGDDVFCHASELKSGDEKDLQDGDTMEYDMEYDRKKDKDRAVNIVATNHSGDRKRSRSRSPRRRGRENSNDNRDDRRRSRYDSRDRRDDRRGGGKGDSRGGDRWEPRKKEMRAGDWNCPKCDFHNFARREDCKECGAYRPDDRAKDNKDDNRGRDNSRGRDRDRSHSRGR